MAVKEKHSHYYKNVRHLNDIDAYRVLERFGVTDPAIQHAVKKLLVAGGRGAGKDQLQDVQEAIDSLTRFQEMQSENDAEQVDAAAAFVSPAVTSKEQAANIARHQLKRNVERPAARKAAAKRPARRSR